MQPTLSEVGWLLSGVLALCTAALGAAMTFAFRTWPQMAKADAEARREDRHAYVNALQAAVNQAYERHREQMAAQATEAARAVDRHHQTMDALARIAEAMARITESLTGRHPRPHQVFPGQTFDPFPFQEPGR